MKETDQDFIQIPEEFKFNIYRMLIDLCQQIGLRSYRVPRLYFHYADLAIIGLIYDVKYWQKLFGGYFDHSNIIFINLDRILPEIKNKKKQMNAIKRTMVHELVHLRFQRLDHGKKFQQTIKDILKGKTFEQEYENQYTVK